MLLKTAFDIDGVFCHTWTLMIELFNEMGYNVVEDDIVEFDLNKCLDIPPADVRKVIDASLARENMDRKIIDTDAVACVRLLHFLTGKTIPFITSRKEPEDTVYFLERYIVKGRFPYKVWHGSWTDGKTCPDRKLEQITEAGCVAMVEDAPETLKLLSEHGIISMLRDRPYNKYATWAFRFSDWREVANLAINLELAYAGRDSS